jgi:hypothetical protein
MDSWMPWTVMRNFIRAFCPTLILVINWDLWRNLGRAEPAKQWAIMTDAVAFGVVLAIRLSPPLAGMGEQLKSLFQAPWVGWFVIGLVLGPLLFPGIMPHDFQHKLLPVAGYAFCGDIARVCKIDYEQSKRSLRFIYTAYGIFAGFASQVISYVEQIREGTFPWRDALSLTAFLLLLIAISAFKWWGEWDGPISHIQELGLNRKLPGGPNP